MGQIKGLGRGGCWGAAEPHLWDRMREGRGGRKGCLGEEESHLSLDLVVKLKAELAQEAVWQLNLFHRGYT